MSSELQWIEELREKQFDNWAQKQYWNRLNKKERRTMRRTAKEPAE